MARAREDVTGDAKDAYDKLLSTVQEVLAATQGIESVWGSRPQELSDGTSLSLEELDPTLLESLEPDLVEADVSQEETGSAPDLAEAPSLETVGVAGSEDGSETPTDGHTGQDPSAATDAPRIYEGEVDLVIKPLADMARIVELHSLLPNVEGISVISTAGSWDRGTTITVSLESPATLDKLAAQIPNIEAAHQPQEKECVWGATVGHLGKSSDRKDRIAITFSTPSEAGIKKDDAGVDGN